VSYAVLCYYKIVELRHKGKAEARSWFGRTYAALKDDKVLSDEFARFEKA
jgi:hypothetical protein